MSRPSVLTGLALAALLALSTGPAGAAPTPENPKKHTSWGLYLTAVEAHAMKQEKGDAVLFVDVRDPVEIMFTGFAVSADVNIPLARADATKWDAKKNAFQMVPNADFASDLRAALAQRGLGPETPILMMCRSGSRSAKAAKALEGQGFATVYNVVDGFEGGAAKTPGNPARNLEGWKNSGLPWSYTLDAAKMRAKAE